MADQAQQPEQAMPAAQAPSTSPSTIDAKVAELQQQVMALQSAMAAMVERLAVHGIYIEASEEPEATEPG